MFDIEIIIIDRHITTTATSAPRPTDTINAPRQPATPPARPPAEAPTLQILEQMGLAHRSW